VQAAPIGVDIMRFYRANLGAIRAQEARDHRFAVAPARPSAAAAHRHARGAWADDGFSANADWGRQVVWVILGACAYAAASAFDYRRLRPIALALYAGMLLLLLAVHLVGHTALGARRWLSVAGFPLEPSELSKLLLVVVLAAYLSRSDRVSWRTFGAALLLAAPPLCLVLTQPDLVPRS